MIKKYIGLCMAAGGVVTGVDLVLGVVRGGKAKLVLLAKDASERTKKQLADKCAYYHTPLAQSDYDGDALAAMLGKRAVCSAIALTGRGPWAQVKALVNPTTEECCEDRKDDC